MWPKCGQGTSRWVGLTYKVNSVYIYLCLHVQQVRMDQVNSAYSSTLHTRHHKRDNQKAHLETLQQYVAESNTVGWVKSAC